MVAESHTAPAAPFPSLSRSPARRKAEGITLRTTKTLNSREKRFCALKVQGWSNRKAYQSATGCKSDATADVQAWRWSARPAIQSAIAKGRAEITEEGAASRAEKRHLLANVMRADDADHRDKLSAVAIDNRMTGDDDPFRKAAGDDLRVSFFVVRVEDDETRNVTPSEAPAIPLLPQ